MSDPVTLRREGAIAVITVDNPPVNALKHAVRAGLQRCFKEADADADVQAIVLTCAGRTFIAGADITEFGKPPMAPTLIDVITDIDNVSKPTVAAIHGTALGGGLEVALGCNYRVATKDAKLGLPEIKLGLIPGAGGTQRLPRLIGVEKALPIILSGNPVSASQALKDGLVDEIVEGDLTAGGIAVAEKAGAGKIPLKRASRIDDKLAALRANPDSYNEIAAKAAGRNRGLKAPMAAIEAVKWTLDVPFEEAVKRERQKFIELLVTEESKSQRHAFFAEREATKVLDMPDGTKARDVKQAAVIGGTMGGGIAMCFANAGIPVMLIETTEEFLKNGLAKIRTNYENTAKRGGIAEADVEKRMSLIKGAVGLEAAKDADMVIEAVFEEMNLKKEIFGKLDAITKKGAVLATNTSTLDVNEIAESTSRPQDVIGMHFFSPANIMKLLEIVRGEKSAFDALQTAISVGRKIGKVPVVVGVCYGFVGNRMLHRRGEQADRLILESALPQEVDAATTEFGFPMGPFAMGDLAGIDVGWRIRRALGKRNEVADTLAEAGRFGQKTGKGYYIYEKGSRTPIPDPEVEKIILDAAARKGIKRSPVSKQEIIERTVYPMINEGARILEEGIAARPGDIDVIWLYGYGWPVWRGGPMHYADTVGLKHIRDRLAHYAKESGDETLQPAALLNKLADEGGTFASLASGMKKAS
ncbi:MAG TPA: 3-hydroxyacyl-CoA dehydrogenase NAD-binding domain-containing protein [Xanthobacteraceae bacterium]|nr:3-hydroxyacyl-CoA dehydrogenase NAD-binding domain-containing protein [Xanthobacteraceae bacterium]